MSTTNHPLFSDAACKTIARRVFRALATLRALDPALVAFIDRFQDRHQRFAERVSTREECQAALQHLMMARESCKVELLTQLRKAWDHVPSAGVTYGEAKSREQVRRERLALCPQGRPTPLHGCARLIEMGNGMVRYLTGDSPLASAWPSAPLDQLQRAIEALEATDEPVHAAREAHKAAYIALHKERLLWAKDFVLLRDNALKLAEPGIEQDRLKALFADWTKEKPSTTRKKKAAQADQAPPEDPEEDEDERDDAPEADNEIEPGETST